ncbi:MAG: hypothetical protein OEZ34_07605 [Spirochaetia bacterium]|nr:hypothetical protein [Spirochaetia bacterium]
MIKIESITKLHEILNQAKPLHPLVSVIDYAKAKNVKKITGTKITANFYSISLKKGSICEMKYGRHYYDFQEGSLVFVAPEQAITVSAGTDKTISASWGLYFHPDLIRKSSLEKK